VIKNLQKSLSFFKSLIFQRLFLARFLPIEKKKRKKAIPQGLKNFT
jgi:hypothetical protein